MKITYLDESDKEIAVTPEQDSSGGVPRIDENVELRSVTWRVSEVIWRPPHGIRVCLLRVRR